MKPITSALRDFEMACSLRVADAGPKEVVKRIAKKLSDAHKDATKALVSAKGSRLALSNAPGGALDDVGNVQKCLSDLAKSEELLTTASDLLNRVIKELQ